MPSARHWGARAAVLLSLALAGCSGTRLGERLSRSFSAAPATPAAGSAVSGTSTRASAPAATGSGGPPPPSSSTNPGKVAADATSPASTPGKTAADADTPAEGKARSTAMSSVPPTTAAPGSPARPVAGRPAPYRVTILLPQADASAPAEVVTQALRAAGVPFEVETIERLGAGSAPPTAGPTVRPAPAPR